MIVESYGIGFRKEAFKKKTFHQFKEQYQFQQPFSEMTPVKRDKALQETWELLKDNSDEVEENKAPDNSDESKPKKYRK